MTSYSGTQETVHYSVAGWAEKSARTILGGLRTGRLVVAESRTVVQFVFLLRLLCALGLAGGGAAWTGWTGVLTVTGWLCLTMAVYVLNGLSDVAGDRENGLDRPIASGRLPLSGAVQATAVLVGAGLLLCALVSRLLVIAAVFMLALGWAYSMGRRPLKATSFGFVPAVGGGALLTYLAGAIGAGTAGDARLAVFAVGMSVWIGVCSAVKDLSDVEGDRLARRCTWPVRYGERRARHLVAAASLVLGCGFAALAAELAPALLPACVPVLGGSAALAAVLLLPVRTADRRARRRPYRVFMGTQYAVHLAVLPTVLV